MPFQTVWIALVFKIIVLHIFNPSSQHGQHEQRKVLNTFMTLRLIHLPDHEDSEDTHMKRNEMKQRELRTTPEKDVVTTRRDLRHKSESNIFRIIRQGGARTTS